MFRVHVEAFIGVLITVLETCASPSKPRTLAAVFIAILSVCHD